MTVYLLLILHIILCAVIGAGIFLGLFKSPFSMFFLALLVPLWGAAAFLFLEVRLRGKQEEGKQVGLERLKINDEIHRSILVDEDSMQEEIVPLEEALLMNTPKLRRELLLDILYSDPETYVEQLKEARMNEDTEVVHYAVTALVELQKEYDLKFQKIDRKYEKDPEAPGLLDEYLRLLESYISSGILEGNMLNAQRRRYSGLLSRKISETPDLRILYLKKAETALLLGAYDEVYQAGKELIWRWKDEEAGYLVMLRYWAVCRNREKLEAVIEEIEKNEVFLSAEGKEFVRFWKESYGKEKTGSDSV